ncbi:MAG: glycosyltransferase family 2 protein [Brevundimonas sp.]|jgi:dolichol-phosphate mannosyltransferase|uniref:glycosyltransferase family 2 protein n=1 Tax=Brevundimonas sp. TaxID=1871086 RepID=UPI003001687E
MTAELPRISVVVPVHDEAGAVETLVTEIAEAFSGRAYEMVLVNDASRDQTLAILQGLKTRFPALRVLSHGANAGQSRAVRTGILAARGEVVVTLDGDGQNPPSEAPKLVDALLAAPPEVALVGGVRQRRQDTGAKLWASRWANRIRKRLLGDDADDTGCGLKAFRRDVFLRLPYFDHIHRYLPALMIREGYQNRYLPITHRARDSGQSKYTNWERLMASLSDLLGVMWLKSRSRNPGQVTEVEGRE